jgi:hypothetical protein
MCVDLLQKSLVINFWKGLGKKEIVTVEYDASKKFIDTIISRVLTEMTREIYISSLKS